MHFQPDGESHQGTTIINGTNTFCQPKKHGPRNINRSTVIRNRSGTKEAGISARGKVLGGPSGNPLEVRHHVLEGARPVFQAATQRHRKPSDGAFVLLDVVRKAQSGVVLLDVFSDLPWRRSNDVAKENRKRGFNHVEKTYKDVSVARPIKQNPTFQ